MFFFCCFLFLFFSKIEPCNDCFIYKQTQISKGILATQKYDLFCLVMFLQDNTPRRLSCWRIALIAFDEIQYLEIQKFR